MEKNLEENSIFAARRPRQQILSCQIPNTLLRSVFSGNLTDVASIGRNMATYADEK